MANITERFLMVGASNDLVKEISTEELIGSTIPSATVKNLVLPRDCEDGRARAKECLRVVAEELGSRGIASTEALLKAMDII